MSRKKGYCRKEETKKKISTTMTGRSRTPEERQAISEGRKKAYNDEYKHFKDLMSINGYNSEAREWLESNMDNLKEDSFEDVLSNKEFNNSSVKSVEYNDNYRFSYCDVEQVYLEAITMRAL